MLQGRLCWLWVKPYALNVASTIFASLTLENYHDDVIKWKHFPRYWSFVRGIHRSPLNSPHKGQWRGALMFSLICAVNKRLSKQSWGWWFETQSHSLWHHCNDNRGSEPHQNDAVLWNENILIAVKHKQCSIAATECLREATKPSPETTLTSHQWCIHLRAI